MKRVSDRTDLRADVYSRITDRIIVELEQGVRPWVQPWSNAHRAHNVTRPLRHNGEPYSGINVLLLWSEAMERAFSSSTWMTFRQALALGANVRKGETGSMVVYANRVTKTETDADGNDSDRDIAFLKAYTVFNTEQIDGLPDTFGSTVARPSPVERVATADAFFRQSGAVIRHGGSQAFYAPGADIVQMPPIEAFHDVESYYATLAHESVHYAVSRIMPNLIRRALELNTNSALMVGIIATGLLSVGYTGRWKSALASSTEALISHPEAWSLMSPIACMNA